jgi:hypothetical protein
MIRCFPKETAGSEPKAVQPLCMRSSCRACRLGAKLGIGNCNGPRLPLDQPENILREMSASVSLSELEELAEISLTQQLNSLTDEPVLPICSSKNGPSS